MADTKIPCAQRLTRGALFGIECRLAKVYGCSPLASKIWIRYARACGKRCSMLERTLDKAIALGRRPLDNLHGERMRVRSFTYGERAVKEAVAREARGERWFMKLKQAG